MVSQITCKGYCKKCGCEHQLTQGNSASFAKQLMEKLEQYENIDFFSGNFKSQCTTAPLFGDARGKMFGVLECINRDEKPVVLYAFSGQFNGVWEVEGWAPPLFSMDTFHQVHDHIEQDIKKLTKKIERLQTAPPPTYPGDKKEKTIQHLTVERRNLSRKLMQDIHTIYKLHNFCGHSASLAEAFLHDSNMPTGTGDCCAPKLLNLAAKQELTPKGMTEFYWGRTNKSATKIHTTFYPSCKEKCEPILGFLLCGIKNRTQTI